MPDQLFQDITAILMAILFLGLSFLIVWVTKSVLKIEGDVLVVALLSVPILLYVILSGRLEEFRGPGGLELKLVAVAEKSVEATAETIEASVEEAPLEETQFVDRGGNPRADLRKLQMLLENIDGTKPIVMTLTVGIPDRYNRDVVLKYLTELSRYQNFRFVVLVDDDNRFVGYLPAGSVRQILETESLGPKFIQMIDEGRIRNLRRYPGVVTSTISTTATNIEALREMIDQNLDALVVIDKDLRPIGVVEREQVLSKLMLAVAK